MVITTPLGSRLSIYFIIPSLPDAMIMGLLIYILCYFLILSEKKLKFSNLWYAMLFVYAGALISLTIPIFSPLAWHMKHTTTAWVIEAIHWQPFDASLLILHNCLRIHNMRPFVRLIIGNFMLLAPLGILVPLINKKFKFVRIFFLSFLVSFSIEALQLASNILIGLTERDVEIDDLILNVGGCVFTYCLFAVVRKLTEIIACFINRRGALSRESLRGN